TNRLNVSNGEGQYVVAEQVALMRENSSAYMRYKFNRPGYGDEEFEKLSHIRRFEPYGWFFGTGVYLDQVKAISYQRILDILSNVTIGDNGYLFVFEENGDTLLRHNQIQVGSGQNLYQEIGESFKTQILSQPAEQVALMRENSSAYMRYKFNRPGYG
ncbi:cache domain-containing protein, partial [Vibrio fortis]